MTAGVVHDPTLDAYLAVLNGNTLLQWDGKEVRLDQVQGAQKGGRVDALVKEDGDQVSEGEEEGGLNHVQNKGAWYFIRQMNNAMPLAVILYDCMTIYHTNNHMHRSIENRRFDFSFK